MSRRCLGSTLHWGIWTSAAASLLFLVVPGPHVPSAGASDDPQPDVVRVEEDWSLQLNVPGDEVDAPQFFTVMSPLNQLNSAYAQFLWNYRELPEFVSGGLQVQGWLDEEDVDIREAADGSLSQDAETVTWTQRMETNGSLVKFRVVQGQSPTWGAFGGQSTEVVVAEAMPNLNQYSPQASKSNSGVSYGSNRVSLLVIQEVRRYSVDGLVSRDTQPVVVFRLKQTDSNHNFD
jgi:hypothetical protein